MEGFEAVILNKVKPVWIAELEDKTNEYFDITMHEIINDLYSHGGYVTTYNEAAMMKERDQPWVPSEHVVSYFNHIEKAIKQLAKTKITSNNNQ